LLKRSGLSNVLLGSLFDDKENAAFRSWTLLPGEQAKPISKADFPRPIFQGGCRGGQNHNFFRNPAAKHKRRMP
jgi:hypothetical protein